MENGKTTRKSIRLPGFDYSQVGAYFVTVCSERRQCLFGEISDFRMEANAVGLLVTACWARLSDDYPFVTPDTWILMPNHLHGILWLGNDNLFKKPLSQIVAAFKATSTSSLRKVLGKNIKLWQRGFYEHIIRNDDDLLRIRNYIDGNPIRWALDPENPQNMGRNPYAVLPDPYEPGACNAPLPNNGGFTLR